MVCVCVKYVTVVACNCEDDYSMDRVFLQHPQHVCSALNFLMFFCFMWNLCSYSADAHAAITWVCVRVASLAHCSVAYCVKLHHSVCPDIMRDGDTIQFLDNI